MSYSRKSPRDRLSYDSKRSYRQEDSSTPSYEFQSRRNRLTGSTTDKSEDIVSAKKGRLEQNKENEEGEMSTWRRKRLEREQQREQREKEEKERALEKEREREKERKEREKEKEKEVPTYRSRFRDREKEKEQKVREKELLGKRDTELERKEADMTITHGRRTRRLREDRRGTGVAYMPPEESEDSSKEAKDALKNAKANEETEDRPSYSRRQRYDRDLASDDSIKTTDRIRGSRGTATGMGAATDSRVPLSTAKDNTIRVTETDPKKLQAQLQEAHIEIQQYKVKLETTMQEKEKLEQKLTQLTEDLKQLNDLKSENSRLKEENGALIRVISKLSKPPT